MTAEVNTRGILINVALSVLREWEVEESFLIMQILVTTKEPLGELQVQVTYKTLEGEKIFVYPS